MLVATYRVGQERARVLKHVPTPRRWLVKGWLSDGVEKLTSEIRSKGPCMASDMIQSGTAAIDEMAKEMPGRNNGGWDLILMR